MFERIPLSIRLITPANILGDSDITALGSEHGGFPFVLFVVMRACKENGKLTLDFRTVNVRPQNRAVTHGHSDVTIEMTS